MESDRSSLEQSMQAEDNRKTQAKRDAGGRSRGKAPESEGFDKKLDGPDRPSV